MECVRFVNFEYIKYKIRLNLGRWSRNVTRSSYSFHGH